ncbi:uncharacterized protein isoform X1 [Musca autumnalis]|uniref:uncharacterized protein isoform X1 n=1 Tax=Musca autumnalis TaxID=221902 RepID=UPI003CED281D
MQEESGYSNKFLQYMCENSKLSQKYSSFHSKNQIDMNKPKLSDFFDQNNVEMATRYNMPTLSKYDTQSRHEDIPRRHHMESVISSGGDADRFLCDNRYHSNALIDAYRPMSKLQYSQMDTACEPNIHMSCKCRPNPSEGLKTNQHKLEDNHHTQDTESLLRGFGNGSEEGSEKSRMSSKTVISRRSSHELKKKVISQCKLQEKIDETLKNYKAIDVGSITEQNKKLKDVPKPSAQCEHCAHIDDNDALSVSLSQQKDVMTEIGKNDFPDNPTQEKLTITADEIVNSKVINPMIRKLQRMYLNSLREEMSLMEDLERLPYKVNEVYKAAVFQPNK